LPIQKPPSNGKGKDARFVNGLVSYELNCAQNGNKILVMNWDLNPKHEIRNSKQSQMTKSQMFKTNKSLRNLNFENSNLFRISIFGFRIFSTPKPCLVPAMPG